MPRSNWVVEVNDVGIGDSEPTQYGPYSKARAGQIAEALNRRMAEGWHATSFPLWNPKIPDLLALYSEAQVEDAEARYSTASRES